MAKEKLSYTIKLWHKKSPDFKCPAHMPRELNLDHAHVETFQLQADSVLDAAENVFAQSQSHSQSWKAGCRSTSVGDIIEVYLGPIGPVVYGVDSATMKKLANHAIHG